MILADGQDVRDLLPDDDRIRLIHLAESPYSIGEKRNFGCERAHGDIVCHWDDDDWSHADRLHVQVDMLLDSGKMVAGFHSMKFTDGAKWWEYQGKPDFALGTSLCYRRSWWKAHKFQPRNIGEDNYFVAEAAAAGQLVNRDAGDLMVAWNHSANTSPRLMGDNWKEL